MRRLLVGLLATLLLLVGVAGIAAGSFAWSTFGSEGRHEIEIGTVESSGAAVYIRSLSLNLVEWADDHVPADALETSVIAESSGPGELFIGVAPADSVQQFLAGVPYDAASEIANGMFITRSVPGLVLPAPTPADQPFWAAQGQGQPASMLWQTDYSGLVLVVMNADGTAQVSATLSAELASPNVFPVAVATIAVGAVLALLGLWLLWRAIRRRPTA